MEFGRIGLRGAPEGWKYGNKDRLEESGIEDGPAGRGFWKETGGGLAGMGF